MNCDMRVQNQSDELIPFGTAAMFILLEMKF